MAPAKGEGAARRRRRGRALLIPATLLLLAAGGCGDDASTDVPPPSTSERADTVPILQRAAESQDICYGWRLQDGGTVVSVGSNLGDAVAVRDNASCPRWVEVVAEVDYTAESSEREDSARIRVESIGITDVADLVYVRDGLQRFGLTEDAFIDEPGWAICRAATMLPLLVAEVGAASPAATPSATPAGDRSPLPAAGNDFWRDRWAGLLGGVGLLLFGGALAAVGAVLRRRHDRPGIPGQRDKSARDATPASGRTRESA